MKITKKIELLGLASVCAGLALTTGCRTIYTEDCSFGGEEAQFAGEETVAPAPLPAGENPMPAALSPVQPGNVIYPTPAKEKEVPYYKVNPNPYAELDKAPAAPVKKVADASGYVTYKVKKNDTLGGIAVKHGVALKDVKALNAGMNYDRLKVGQVVYLPANAKAKAVAATTKAAVSADGTYVVKSGDILGRIARQFGVKVSELKAANNLTSDMIKVGQKLVIPGKKAAAKTANATKKTTAEKTVAPVKENPPKVEVVTPSVEVAPPPVAVPVIPTTPPVVETPAIPVPIAPDVPTAQEPAVKSPSAALVPPAAPAPAVAAPEAKPIQLRDYTVGEGEDLISIAINHSVGIDTLRKMNPGVVEPLVPGTVIKVPVNDK